MPLIRTAMEAPRAADAADPAAPPDAADGRRLADRPSGALRHIFAPLQTLLLSGGDTRLTVNPASRLNAYGCLAFPTEGAAGFSSCTATPISQRAFDRTARAREKLLRSTIAEGLDAAFDARIEAMRDELTAHLGLQQSGTAVVFSPSGTDSQLQALFLTRELFGSWPTTIVLAADQTGRGAALTARGLHFSGSTSNGIEVCKGQPVCERTGAARSLWLPVRDELGEVRTAAAYDQQVGDAVEGVMAAGGNVLLQIMDASKLGWRLPSDGYVQEILARWPGRIQVVVDACQMRSSRKRLAAYLERGCLVLVTGSKFFTGPAFSGAMLVPAAVSERIERSGLMLPQLTPYCTRSDWPQRWPALRAQFSNRPNFGQWLRWEAALEEMRAYYAVPGEFRHAALTALGDGITRLIASSRSLRLLPPQQNAAAVGVDDDEMQLPTIFAFTLQQDGHSLSLEGCRAIHGALAGDIQRCLASDCPEIAAQSYLVGQPVGWQLADGRCIGALRICIGARHVTECWPASAATARRRNLRRVLGRVTCVIDKLDARLCHQSRPLEYAHAP